MEVTVTVTKVVSIPWYIVITYDNSSKQNEIILNVIKEVYEISVQMNVWKRTKIASE